MNSILDWSLRGAEVNGVISNNTEAPPSSGATLEGRQTLVKLRSVKIYVFCIPITINNLLKASFSNKKYYISITN